ncbi:hypothetical protein JVT61DRAFT_9864 [Boletus reticuloceps]|uniref:Uncharacterized protein n=1 Tax=Boletus reticuloceps TaxID=495285 RepID=A0A8I3A439_9AGAM|nr:hypothetical protein JVT61DRAFT_12558 [Boletus reticuloceps]KAG6371239.1 hypothetical protein JVT61DRAFT_9864 [Boletus reticuloceps]
MCSTLRFTTSKPIDVVVYSADFAMIPANTTTGTGTGTGASAGASAGMGSGAVALATPSGTNTGTGTGTLAGSGFKTVPTATDAVSTGTTITTTTSTTNTSASDRSGSMTPSGVPPPSGTLLGGGVSEGQRAASAGRRGVDVEKLKFRFVFVIWPVLMGITMAL